MRIYSGMMQVVGTVGYAAPEYIQTGRLTSKSDVWSFGIFVYELITGRRPLDRNKPRNEQKLIEWIRPHLSDLKKFEQILDPRLEGKYSLKSAQKLAAIANRCLARHPKNRPRMSEVLEMINQIEEASEPKIPPAPLTSSDVKDAEEKSTIQRVKRRFVHHITGNERWLHLRTLKSKLVRPS